MTERDLGRWPVDDTHLVLRGIESTHEFPGLLQSVTYRSLTIFTAQHAQDVGISVDVSTSEPAKHPGAWDEVVETTVRPTGPQDVVLVSIDRARPRGEQLLPANSGTYRLRVYQRGRIEPGPDGAHLYMAFWPAPPAPPRVLVGHSTVSEARPHTTTQPDGTSPSGRDQRLVDDMTRRLIDRARKRQGG